MRRFIDKIDEIWTVTTNTKHGGDYVFQHLMVWVISFHKQWVGAKMERMVLTIRLHWTDHLIETNVER